MNKVMIVGNLTADPELRTTPNGTAVCSFRVAVSRRFKDADGNQATDFIPVTAWRQLAELAGKYLAKGRKVAVVGSLQTRSYEDKTGAKRTAYDVIADEIEFLTPRSSTEGGGSTYSPPANKNKDDVFSDDSGFSDLDDSSLPF